MGKIKVIVVDDSALMRKIISDMINSEKDMEVINIAKNGDDLLKKLKIIPDVITLDVEMPIINGIDTLKILQKSNINIHIIMLSSLTKFGADITMECLEHGAFDFVAKPSGSISLDIDRVKEELIDKIRMAKQSTLRPYSKVSKIVESKNNRNYKKKTINTYNKEKSIRAVVIGASTGGPKALFEVISKLPILDIPIFVVQHMPIGFTKSLANRLNSQSKLTVVEAMDNDRIVKNKVYIAKAGYHMKIINNNRIKLDGGEPLWGVKPAVDKLFFSAVKVFKADILSLVMTGMGKDGAEGTAVIKDAGGITLAQDEQSSTIYGMPKAAYLTGKVDEVVSLSNIPYRISDIILKKGV